MKRKKLTEGKPPLVSIFTQICQRCKGLRRLSGVCSCFSVLLRVNGSASTCIDPYIIYYRSKWREINPANTRRWPNVGIKLAHRLRCCPNISPTLDQRPVLAGKGGSGANHFVFIT